MNFGGMVAAGTAATLTILGLVVLLRSQKNKESAGTQSNGNNSQQQMLNGSALRQIIDGDRLNRNLGVGGIEQNMGGNDLVHDLGMGRHMGNNAPTEEARLVQEVCGDRVHVEIDPRTGMLTQKTQNDLYEAARMRALFHASLSHDAYGTAWDLVSNALNLIPQKVRAYCYGKGLTPEETHKFVINNVAMAIDICNAGGSDGRGHRPWDNSYWENLPKLYYNPNDNRPYIEQMVSLQSQGRFKHGYTEHDKDYDKIELDYSCGYLVGWKIRENGGWENRENGGVTYVKFIET